MFYFYTSIILNKINNFLLTKFNKNNILSLVNNCEITSDISEKYKNKILLNIVNIQKEETDITNDYYEPFGNQYIKKIKPTYYYLYAFIHSTYVDENVNLGLTYISEIVSYINSNPLISNENTIEIKENNFSDINIFLQNDDKNLFGKLKIPYIPSILIKYGLIPINSQQPYEKPVSGITSF